MSLALIDDLSTLIKSDCKDFVTKLDLITPTKPSLAEYVESLREPHAEGLKLLRRNGQFELRKQRLILKKAMIKEGLPNMSLTRMRFYGKRLGVRNATKTKQRDLREILMKI